MPGIDAKCAHFVRMLPAAPKIAAHEWRAQGAYAQNARGTERSEAKRRRRPIHHFQKPLRRPHELYKSCVDLQADAGQKPARVGPFDRVVEREHIVLCLLERGKRVGRAAREDHQRYLEMWRADRARSRWGACT
eukprot:6176932-Pleurochrysis_carterae.AAC.1